MKSRSACGAAFLALLVCASAGAAPIVYQGTLLPNVAATGTTGGFSYFLEDVSQGIQFWRFSANAGSAIRIEVDRLNANLDPAFSLYFGTTTADSSLFSASSSWGGLAFLAAADDEIMRNAFNGDPLLSGFVAPFTGLYTIATGGSLSTDARLYPYVVTFSVPAPASLPLVGLGLFALAWNRSCTRRPRVPSSSSG